MGPDTIKLEQSNARFTNNILGTILSFYVFDQNFTRGFSSEFDWRRITFGSGDGFVVNQWWINSSMHGCAYELRNFPAFIDERDNE